MNKKLISTFILSAFLLTGCADTESNESVPTDSVSEKITSSIEPNTETADFISKEALTETEENYVFISPYPKLMYNGGIYSYGIYSSQTELDGKYYEVLYADEEGKKDEAWFEAEQMKNECEYIGKSIPNHDPLATPAQELEITASDEVYELYKIDENQILLYSLCDLEIPDTWRDQAIVYPGTYRRHYILIKDDRFEELISELEAEYYRYAERFPDEDWWKTESEQNSQTTDVSSSSEFPPEGITAPITTTPSTYPHYATDEAVPAGSHYINSFEFDGVEYTEGIDSFGFVIEDNGNIVVEGEPEYEDNKVVQALRELYSLEYVGQTPWNEHLFRFGDDMLAIAKSPAEKIHSVYFKDFDYDESQFYYALMYEPKISAQNPTTTE